MSVSPPKWTDGNVQPDSAASPGVLPDAPALPVASHLVVSRETQARHALSREPRPTVQDGVAGQEEVSGRVFG